MQFILDHISSTIVGGVVLLVLIVTTARNQDAQVDAIRYYSGRLNMVQLTEMLERDLRNLGSGVPPGIDEIIAYDWSASTPYIEFYTQEDTIAGLPARRVRYELQKTRVMYSQESGRVDSVQCYELIRRKWVAGSFVDDGRSMDTLTDISIDLLDVALQPITSNFDQTRFIQVDLEAIPPLGQERSLKRFRWRNRYHPINLSF